MPNLKFVSLAVLELLAFNAQTFTGSRDPNHAHFSETYVGTIPGNIRCMRKLYIIMKALNGFLVIQREMSDDLENI